MLGGDHFIAGLVCNHNMARSFGTMAVVAVFACLVCAPVGLAQDSGDPVAPLATRATTRQSGQLYSTTELSRQVNTSIDRGVQYLLSRQTADGGWVPDAPEGYGIGPTALVTFALLACGEQPTSKEMAAAIKLLKRVNGYDSNAVTYSVGLRASVWRMLPQSTRAAELREDLAWLLGHSMPGEMRGMYNYGPRGAGDYSNSQYGVLGAWAAADAGLDVPLNYWRNVEAAWLRGQLTDGGWGYRQNGPASYASMTAAAVATLFITNDYLHAREYQDLTREVKNVPLEAGLKWLAENFAPDDNTNHGQSGMARRGGNRGGAVRGVPRGVQRGAGRGPMPGEVPANDNSRDRDSSDPWLHYTLFAYERVGEASGLTRFGDRVWYDEGAGHLINTQRYDGSWVGRNEPEIATAYALLFLARGRAPVLVQKLEFGERSNNRPRDVAAFTRFMRHATERHVNWQALPISSTPEQFRASPLLYAASDRPMTLTAEQKQTVKTYLDQGGLLVAVNEGRTDAFARSIVALCKEFYPGYVFRELPKTHQVYTANFNVRLPGGPIRALSNGLRELVVLYPSGEMSWQWHSTGGAFAAQNSPFASLANLWLYATDRANPRFKGEDPWVDRNPGVQIGRSVRVARIRHDNNWDPEPGGWIRLSNVMANFDQVELSTIAATSSIPTNISLAHLTATQSIALAPGTKSAIRTYLSSGGVLLADAAGGSSEVPGSLEALMKELFPDAAIAPLPLTHPIYGGKSYGAEDIDAVEYRRTPNAPTVKIPRLRGVTSNGKLVAILSNEDMSGALVGYSHSGLVGYTPASAMDLMRNIVLWRVSLQRSPAP